MVTGDAPAAEGAADGRVQSYNFRLCLTQACPCTEPCSALPRRRCTPHPAHHHHRDAVGMEEFARHLGGPPRIHSLNARSVGFERVRGKPVDVERNEARHQGIGRLEIQSKASRDEALHPRKFLFRGRVAFYPLEPVEQ